MKYQNLTTWQLSYETIFLVAFSLPVKTDKWHVPARHGRLLTGLNVLQPYCANPELEF